MIPEIRIDLLSDTVTKPTDEMRQAMVKAEVGDDVYGEDVTANKLEELAAAKVGKEAALFVPTGSMGNLLAAITHCSRGEEVILERTSHFYDCEVGGLASLAGLTAYPIDTEKGIFTPEQIEEAIRPEDIHYTTTGLISIENTHNRRGGTVTPIETQKKIYEVAKAHGVPMHLDGARVFNAATALKVDVKEITQYCDTVQFCLSKGLCAPVGSILAGSSEFIERARKNRKKLGGGMRQIGFLAAAGIIALESMVDRLEEDHKNAYLLAEELNKLPMIKVNMDLVQTNMVYVDTTELPISAEELNEKLIEKQVRGSDEGVQELRLVTHHGITEADILEAVEIFAQIIKEYEA